MPPSLRIVDAPPALLVSLTVDLDATSESELFGGLDTVDGVFVATYREWPPATRFALVLRVQGAEVRASGILSWSRGASEECPPGVGIAFEEGVQDDARAPVERLSTARPPLFIDLEAEPAHDGDAAGVEHAASGHFPVFGGGAQDDEARTATL